jgi:MYXO-CTERM domain-containing protein
MGLVSWGLAWVVAWGAGAAPGLSVLREVEARHARGHLDDETMHLYRVAAAKDRSLLPPDLRDLPASREDGRRLTAVMVEAYQWLVRQGGGDGRLKALMAVPADMPQVLDSAILPIRVSAAANEDPTLVREVLAATEYSWTVQTDQFGFYAPPVPQSLGRYRVFIDSTEGHGSAYTAPFGTNPATPWSDCFTYVVFDPYWAADSVGSIMAHEMNHAAQAAMDCQEVVTFWENTSTYIMGEVYPDGRYYARWMMSAFQATPWRALDFMNSRESDGYEYGGVLLPIFLTATWAPQDGPVFMRQVWEATMQDGEYNRVDYFDAIMTALQPRGGPPDFDSLFMAFSEARLFLGNDDDGQHMPGASEFVEAYLEMTSFHTSNELPIAGATPPPAQRPAPYGLNFIMLYVSQSFGQDLRFTISADPDVTWYVKAFMSRGPEPPATVEIPVDRWTLEGSAVLPTAGRGRLVVMVGNLGDGRYDPNDRRWPLSGYYYSMEAVAPPPSVTGVTPAQVVRGTRGNRVTLQGSGFTAGSGFSVAVDNPGVHVSAVDQVQATAVKVKLDVDADTTLGPCGVTVTNPGGLQVTAPGVLEVVEVTRADGGVRRDAGGLAPDADTTPGHDDDGPAVPGCACQGERGGGGGPAWLGLLAVATAWRRRGRGRTA